MRVKRENVKRKTGAMIAVSIPRVLANGMLLAIGPCK